jgi:hypothetical protein
MDCKKQMSIMVIPIKLIDESTYNFHQFTEIIDNTVLSIADLKKLRQIIESQLVIANTAKYIYTEQPASLDDNINTEYSTIIVKICEHIVKIFILMFNHNITQKHFNLNKTIELSNERFSSNIAHKRKNDYETECANIHIMGGNIEQNYTDQSDSKENDLEDDSKYISLEQINILDKINDSITILTDTILLIRNLLATKDQPAHLGIFDSCLADFIIINQSKQRITSETEPTIITRKLSDVELSQIEHELDYAPINTRSLIIDYFILPFACSCVVTSVITAFLYWKRY